MFGFWKKRKPTSEKADPTRALNAPGKYYVNGTSLFCGLCPMLAPNNCRMNDARATCEVFKQPESSEEVAQLRHAMEQSCVQCIRDDGDDEWGQPPCEVLESHPSQFFRSKNRNS